MTKILNLVKTKGRELRVIIGFIMPDMLNYKNKIYPAKTKKINNFAHY
jgi:hypothetical protein